jgi:TolC family type I secretion outer membrane protein
MTASNIRTKNAKLILLGLALSILLIGAGCASVRQARNAQKTDSLPPGERTLTAAEIGLTSNSVLTLEEALRIALAYHPSIAAASQDVVAARSQLRQARAGYGPSVDAGAGYTRSTANAQGTPSSSESDDSYRGSVGLDLLIYDFGKTPAAARQAYLRHQAALYSLQSARNDAAYNTRTAFFNLGKAQELFQVAEEAVRQYTAHLDQVRAFADVGRRMRYDVTKAEVDLGNAQLDLINARNELTTARATLNGCLGLAESPEYQIAGSSPEILQVSQEDLMAAARKKHPELLALKTDELVASAAVDAAIADLYPTLQLKAEYALSGASFPLVWNWSGMLQAAIPLFNSGKKTAAIDEAAAQLRAARAQTTEREQQLYVDLTGAVSQLESARRRMDLTTLIERQARESLDLINERYRLGKASAVEVTDAQATLTSAQADQVKARFEYQTAAAQIKHAIGEE